MTLILSKEDMEKRRKHFDRIDHDALMAKYKETHSQALADYIEMRFGDIQDRMYYDFEASEPEY